MTLHPNALLSALQATEKIGVRGRSKQSMWAASVYMACRQELMPRTFKEILAGAPGTTKAPPPPPPPLSNVGPCAHLLSQSLDA